MFAWVYSDASRGRRVHSSSHGARLVVVGEIGFACDYSCTPRGRLFHSRSLGFAPKGRRVHSDSLRFTLVRL